MSAMSAKLRIGEAHALLRAEFPDIELSKIRYYEEKGLVNPSRSPKGFRLFSEVDIECLRESFRMAQREFLPLKVIRQRLIERGLLPDDRVIPTVRRAARDATATNITMAVPERTPRPTLHVVQPEIPLVTEYPSLATSNLSEIELCVAAGITPQELVDLVAFGFLAASDGGATTPYTAKDVQVAKAFSALSALGVDARRLSPVKRIAEREAEVVSELTTSVRYDRNMTEEESAHVVAEVSREVALFRAAVARNITR